MALLIYPPDQHETDSKTIFFIGWAKQYCKINNQEIQLSNAGNFAHVVKLKLGENKFELELDGEKFPRSIIGKAGKQNHPIAYARHYGAFEPEIKSTKNILRSILLEKNKIIIPLYAEPVYKLEQSSAYKASLDLGSMDIDLDWIHYLDENLPVIVGEITSVAKIPISFKKPIKKILSKWENNSLILELEYLPLQNLICIDPGHGGTQIGTVSPKGILEKDLNLSLALLLAEELKSMNCNYILTRDKDIDLSLEKRVELTKLNNAKFFVSLHHNALPDGRDPNQERGMSVHYYHEDSRDLARALLTQLTESLDLPSAGLYRQNLHVLRENDDVLAILIELGFLIHPEESEIITRQAFQIKAAKTIAKFLNQYLNTL